MAPDVKCRSYQPMRSSKELNVESDLSRSVVRILLATSVFAAITGCAAQPADRDAAAESTWREAIVANPTAETGCFHAAYPDLAWQPVQCTTAPARAFTVGDGSD